MAAKKGNRYSPGRPKGSQNKETKKVRQWIGRFLEDTTELLEKDILELDPKDRVNAIMGLLEYSVPKLARTELVGDEEGSGVTINVITKSIADSRDHNA